MDLDKQYNEWLKDQTFEDVNTEEFKNELIKELTLLSSMSVEEYTLYMKWLQLSKRYGNKIFKKEEENLNIFFSKNKVDDSNTGIELVDYVKNNIWIPKEPNDYLNLNIELVWTNGEDNLIKMWNCMRDFCSSGVNNSNIGRNLGFIARDRNTQKILGCITVSSDFMDLTARDSYIGWSREIKTTQKMINHTCIGSTIVPTQPLGYSYVGGKLLALLTLSRVVEDAWNSRYKDKLVGVTTTSLYGSFSQYNGLKHWKKMGHSSGKIRYVPSDTTISKLKNWLKTNHTRKYWEWFEAKRESGLPLKRDHRQRSLNFTYSKLKIDKKIQEADHERGIYFCTLFENTNEFLRKEIDESQLIRKFDNSVESLSELWKTKYAKKRVESLLKQGRYTDESLFYSDIINMTWEEAREKYLKQVGR